MPRPSVYLNLTRAVNAPTAATNALTAAAVVSTTLPTIPTLLALLSATLFYLGGLALNDVLDARDDRTNKPSRPIPANQISRLHAAAVALTLLSAGLLLAATAGPRPGLAALLLYAAILAYNTLHRTNAATAATAAILMGLCRALIYPLAALIAIADTPSQSIAPIILPALAIGASTALFTAAARHEDQPQAIRNATRNRLLAAAVPAPAFALLLLIPTDPTPLTIPVAALLALWSIHAARSAIAQNMRTAVLAWIASLSLIDALILSLIGRPTLAIIALAAFAATVTLQHLGSTKVSGT